MSIAPCAATPPAGASGIQLEDQEFPKKCGHTEFRRVIPAADAIAKIRVAVDCAAKHVTFSYRGADRRALRRRDGCGLAARRGFSESRRRCAVRRESREPRGIAPRRRDLQWARPCWPTWSRAAGHRICRAVNWRAMGFKLALYPGSCFLTAAGALQVVYRQLKTAGTSHRQQGADVCRSPT